MKFRVSGGLVGGAIGGWPLGTITIVGDAMMKAEWHGSLQRSIVFFLRRPLRRSRGRWSASCSPCSSAGWSTNCETTTGRFATPSDATAS